MLDLAYKSLQGVVSNSTRERTQESPVRSKGFRKKTALFASWILVLGTFFLWVLFGLSWWWWQARLIFPSAADEIISVISNISMNAIAKNTDEWVEQTVSFSQETAVTALMQKVSVSSSSAYSPDVILQSEAILKPLIEARLHAQTSEIRNVIVVDAWGGLLYYSRDRVPSNVATTQWWKVINETPAKSQESEKDSTSVVWWGEPEFDTDNNWLQPVAVPIYDVNKKLVGAIKITYSLEDIVFPINTLDSATLIAFISDSTQVPILSSYSAETSNLLLDTPAEEIAFVSDTSERITCKDLVLNTNQNKYKTMRVCVKHRTVPDEWLLNTLSSISPIHVLIWLVAGFVLVVGSIFSLSYQYRNSV